jgi:Cu-Zn family superoxide dismutase
MRRLSVFACLLVVSTGALAKELKVDVNKISDSGVGDKIGEITISESAKGASFKVAVTGVPKGEHGFHVHENGNCGSGIKDGKAVAGLAAGNHYDPEGTKSHEGPGGDGHKGDTPKLSATDDGIEQTVTAPRLKLADIAGRSIVIHEGGDNYSDNPENGGGKGRIACGVIPKS